MAPNSIKSTPRKTPLKDCLAFNKKGKGKGFDVGNPESCTEEIITTYILEAITTYEELDFHDEDLWEVFREDFQGRTIEIFNKADKKATRILRDHLRENGVWVHKKQAFPIARALTDILLEEKQHAWTKEETEMQSQSLKPFKSRRNTNKTLPTGNLANSDDIYRLNPPVTFPEMSEPLQRSPYHPIKSMLQPASITSSNLIRHQLQLGLKTKPDQGTVRNQSDSLMQPIASEVAEEFCQSPVRPINKANLAGKSHFPPITPIKHTQIHPLGFSPQLGLPILPRHPVGDHRQYQNNLHERPLPKPSKTPCQLPIHELANLSKMYRDEDRYGGAEHSFELCLEIFYDTCRRTGVQTQFYKDAFSSMLKGSAQEYYHLYLMNSNLTFDQMTTRLKAHFETAERQEQMLSKWKNLSLQRLIEENPTISYAEYFEVLVKGLRRTQLSLPNRYQGDESLRDAVVDAVHDVRE